MALTARKVHFVPISVGYELIVEQQSYVDELSGADKRKESIGGLLKPYLAEEGKSWLCPSSNDGYFKLNGDDPYWGRSGVNEFLPTLSVSATAVTPRSVIVRRTSVQLDRAVPSELRYQKLSTSAVASA